MIELLQFPFMQRALIAGIVLALLLAFLGIFVILRKMAFWGEGIAHASLAGIAIGLLVSYNPLITAIIFAIIFAILVYVLERKTSLAGDVIIGILFTASMALGIVLINLQSSYQPDVMSFLFGNILAILNSELYIMIIFSILVLLFLIFFRKQLTLLTFDRESAYLAGINVDAFDLIFYICLAISVVLGVKILGIILVSALLIIPASIAKLIAQSFSMLEYLSIIFAEIIVIVGLIVSYYFNLPSGATIILTGTFLFLLTLLIKRFKLI